MMEIPVGGPKPKNEHYGVILKQNGAACDIFSHSHTLDLIGVLAQGKRTERRENSSGLDMSS